MKTALARLRKVEAAARAVVAAYETWEPHDDSDSGLDAVERLCDAAEALRAVLGDDVARKEA